MVFKHYLLKVDKLHTIYIQESGNPKGIPILVLHGGPGYPLDNSHIVATKLEDKIRGPNRFIPENKFRIITFHQRGTGLSKPLGSLKKNKTKYLIQDIEKIRQVLGIKKWVVEGHSWGATLALAYTEEHPSKVRYLILTGLSIMDEVGESVTRIVAPDVHDMFLNKNKNKNKTDKEILLEYVKILSKVLDKCLEKNHSSLYCKLSKKEKSVLKSSQYESETAKIMGDFPVSRKRRSRKRSRKKGSTHKKDPTIFQIASAIIEMYYYAHGGFVNEKKNLIKNAYKIKNVPGSILHGRFDIVCNPSGSYFLSKHWKKADMIFVPMAGHSFMSKNMEKELKKIYSKL